MIDNLELFEIKEREQEQQAKKEERDRAVERHADDVVIEREFDGGD
ncbi:hypothetical protein [Brochothrix phage ADU4]|uniref:Gp46 n=1 Tax=Brochothrix phage A9 TaxID=857312 RepID=D9J0J3_9CAUD|nr:gp46 [Brochothrix phage A9]ADJ53088.1 gp46 [Brochothrix phage A9]UKM96440.1 hypothetical protein [Brochothrix phage ADU4]